MPNTLGLDDDGDDVDIVRELEASFGIVISEDEAANCCTVGDVFDLLRRRLSTSSDDSGGCVSAMAFYRLRRAIAETVGASKAAPATLLEDMSANSPRRLFREIRSKTNLRLPALRFAWLGCIGVALTLACLLVPVALAARSFHWAAAALATTAIGLALVRLDDRRFPPGCRTIGDLARKVSGLNFGLLLSQGAALCEKQLWSALLEVLEENTTLPKTEIGRDTLLLQSQLRAT